MYNIMVEKLASENVWNSAFTDKFTFSKSQNAKEKDISLSTFLYALED